jgi:hypothetical protein
MGLKFRRSGFEVILKMRAKNEEGILKSMPLNLMALISESKKPSFSKKTWFLCV